DFPNYRSYLADEIARQRDSTSTPDSIQVAVMEAHALLIQTKTADAGQARKKLADEAVQRIVDYVRNNNALTREATERLLHGAQTLDRLSREFPKCKDEILPVAEKLYLAWHKGTTQPDSQLVVAEFLGRQDGRTKDALKWCEDALAKSRPDMTFS